MNIKKFRFHKNKKSRGQSLVELAISLPLFLLLIAGITEIGNLLVQRQRLTTAVDMGVRFGSRGGSDEGIYTSAFNVLTQTLPLGDEELWDIFIVRGQVNNDGTGWNEFTLQHIYGDRQTEAYTNTLNYSITLQSEILQGLQTRAEVDTSNNVVNILQNTNDGRIQSENEKIVGMIMSHKAETILGIQNYFGEDVVLSGQKYMTIHTVGEQTDGCDLYPIAISSGARGVDSGDGGDAYYDSTSTVFDANDDFQNYWDLDKYIYPGSVNNRPQWDQFRVRSGSGERPIIDSVEGDVYIIYEGVTFDWVYWAQDRTTAQDMEWPGRSDEYDYYFPDYGLDPSPGRGFHFGDRIRHSCGANVAKAAGAIVSTSGLC
ncbi:MAG: TadE family protein, partial [Chloroflexota bacterium]